MEILELPVAEEKEETSQWGDSNSPKFDEREFIAALDLWRDASRPDENE
jgi:hypothetical protein